MKKGLVLEGGAMRGMYTAGVIDVLLENGMEFDGAVGVSAGAVFGCNYKSKQIGRTIRYNKRFSRDKRFGGMHSLITTGNYYNVEFGYEDIPFKYDVFDIKTFKENPMEFYVVATNVETGKPEYYKCENGDRKDVKWMRASASMPLVSKVVEIDGKGYLDGGISDSIPIRWFREIGYKRNVVILTRPLEYRKKDSKMQGIISFVMRKYPNVVKAMKSRAKDYNETLDEIARLEEQGDTYVIRPSDEENIKRTEKNPEELERVYQIGRKDGMKKLEEVKAFLAKE